MPPISRPRPEFPGSFADRDVLPEIAGRTLGQLSTGRTAVRLWCRACGRDILITPLGLRRRYMGAMSATVEALVRSSSCVSCGAREAQASGWPLEPHEMAQEVIVRRERASGPRLDRR